MSKQILVISAGLVHPNLACRYHLKKLLRSQTEYTFLFTSRLRALQLLSRFDGVVLYFHKQKISESQLEALEDFVSNGGGVLALHSASASFKQNDRYYNLIGGRFIQHGKISAFTVDKVHSENEIYKSTAGFSVTDELYIHEYREDVTVHFTTLVNNRAEPVVWTRKSGKGKISYCSLGHCAAVLKHPRVRAIINQSLDWILK